MIYNMFPAVQVDCEMIKELILNQTVSANLVLLLVAGLPYSGKSTVIRNVINASGTCKVLHMLLHRTLHAYH